MRISARLSIFNRATERAAGVIINGARETRKASMLIEKRANCIRSGPRSFSSQCIDPWQESNGELNETNDSWHCLTLRLKSAWVHSGPFTSPYVVSVLKILLRTFHVSCNTISPSPRHGTGLKCVICVGACELDRTSVIL